MIKIAFIIDTIATPSAGTEQQLLMLIDNLNRNEFTPYLICLRESAWLKDRQFDFPVHVFNCTKLLSPKMLTFIRQLRALHKRERFDIAQTFFADGNMIGVPAAKLAGIKIILASRRNAGDRLSAIQLNILRALKHITSKYVANSRAIAENTMRIEGIRQDKFKVIYNGMYLDRFSKITPDLKLKQRAAWNIAEDDILIGAVANLRPVKNIESLINAASVLVKKHSDLKFVVAGEGRHRDRLQSMINSAGLSERFRLLGSYDEIIPCLAAFDIGVLCSKAEGFSNSLIEYMAAGLPVAASDVGGNPEAIDHNKTGLIYSLEGSDGLIEALSQLIENKPLAETMGKSARTRAFEKYDVSSYVKNHEDFYTEIVESNR